MVAGTGEWVQENWTVTSTRKQIPDKIQQSWSLDWENINNTLSGFRRIQWHYIHVYKCQMKHTFFDS